MPKKIDASQRTADMLRTLTIVQLALADVPQANIRKIVGVSINEVNAVVKLLPKRRGKD